MNLIPFKCIVTLFVSIINSQADVVNSNMPIALLSPCFTDLHLDVSFTFHLFVFRSFPIHDSAQILAAKLASWQKEVNNFINFHKKLIRS